MGIGVANPGHTWAVSRALPIIAPAYQQGIRICKKLLNHAWSNIFVFYYAQLL